MAIQVFGAPAAVVMLNRAFGDTSPGNLIYQNQVAAATANQTAFANDFGAGYASLSNADLAARVLGNLGLLPNDALQTALADYYAANGAANRGFVTLQLCNILAAKEGDATYGAAAAAWNAEVAAAYNYSANEANTSSSGSSAAAPTSFTTAAGETLTGTSGDDTFTGGTFNSDATVNSGDVVNGGAGTDTVRINAEGGSALLELNDVERLQFRMLSSQSMNGASWGSLETVEVLSSSVSGTTLTITNAKVAPEYVLGAVGSLDVTFAASGTAKLELGGYGTGGDAITVSLRNAGDVEIDNVGVNDINDLNATAKTIDIDGEGTLTIVAINNGISAIDTTGFTSGAVAVTVSAASVLSYSGGAGNDTLTLSDVATLTSADTLRGGAGTDTIVAVLDSGSDLDNVTGFERGTFSAGDAVTENFSGFTTLTFSGLGNNSLVATSLSDATVNLRMASANGVTLGGAGALTLNFNNSADVTYGDVNASGFSTVAIGVSNATASSTLGQLGATGADSISITLSGSADFAVSQLRARDAESLTATVGGDANSLTLTEVRGSGLTSVSYSVNGSAATLDAGSIAGSGQDLSFTLDAAGNAADVDVGSITLGSGAALTVAITAAGNATVGSATNFEATVGADGDISLTITAAGSATVSASDFLSDGGISLISLQAGVSGNIAIDSAVAAASISSILVSGARDARIDIDTIQGGSGIDAISVVAGSSAQVTLSTSQTNDEIGGIAVTGSGSVTFTGFRASAAAGDITVTDAAVTFGTMSAKTVGNLSFGGQSGSLTIDASAVGDISITGSSFTLVIGDATGIGDVTIAGRGDISVDFGDVSGIDSISTVGNVSAATLNLSGAGKANELTLGTGTNVVILSNYADTVTFAAGTGTDTLRFQYTASNARSITNFQLASAASDTISLSTATFKLGVGVTAVTMTNSGGSYLDVAKVTAMTTLTMASGSSTVDDATDLIVLATASYGSGASMLATLKNLVTGGGASATTAGQLGVLWYNSDTQQTTLSLLTMTSADSLGSAVAGGTLTNIAAFNGNDIITSITGDLFTNVFQQH